MRVFDVFKANRILTDILAQQPKFNIQLAYKLYKLKKKLDEIENFTMERMEIIFGNDFNSEKMDDTQKVIYNEILSSEINETLPYVTMDEMLNEAEIKIRVEDIEYLEKIWSNMHS